ncbi:hypothetical protein AB0469_14495 [Streptomyces sp. NPDC093801]|uniref:hypothetical protein n=1 Tax=Streptomyces sp. NPDC093801 TaxID=3155203 RepID=UPI00344E567F
MGDRPEDRPVLQDVIANVHSTVAGALAYAATGSEEIGGMVKEGTKNLINNTLDENRRTMSDDEMDEYVKWQEIATPYMGG